MAVTCIGKFAKKWRQQHGLVLYARRDTPAPHIELDDELGMTPPWSDKTVTVDQDPFTCVMWIRSLAINFESCFLTFH